jgi:iron(III) transport system permease protein
MGGPGRAWRVVAGGRGFVWLALAVATVFVLPVLAVVVNVFAPSGGAWSHLVDTVLPHYIANTLWLVLGVGLGVPVIGAGTAWLVTMCRFPGRRVFEWALILPLAVPAYVMAYTYTDFLHTPTPTSCSSPGRCRACCAT